MNILRSLAWLMLFAPFTVSAQGVLISPTPGQPDPSAILELDDPTKGFLMTRMTTAQRNAIVNPAVGLTIYNITSQCFEGYFNSGWKALECDCSNPPSVPGSISGIVTACPGQTGVTYSISPVPGASSYTWTVPGGATITAGQGTNSITVTFGNNSGQVSVVANNTCGTSSASSTTVTVSALDASFTVNPGTPSVNSPAVFSAVTSGLTYAWTFPSGNPATASVQSPSVTWSSTGTYQVMLIVNNGSCSDTSIQTITVTNCLPPQGQGVDFIYTGGVQTWTVPAGVCSIVIECWGAQGGTNGGLGGYATGTLTVTGGQQLSIYVGGQGTSNGAGGYNGGGNSQGSTYGGSGGGASDVRSGGNTLNDRIIVAGGGGGGTNGSTPLTGGGGGGLTGNAGTSGGGFTSGGGGTPSAGGAGGCCYSGTQAGTLGVGGGNGSYHNAGGGGGYYGGGSGAGHAGAGGGSSYLGGVTSSSTQPAIRSGNGLVRITY